MSRLITKNPIAIRQLMSETIFQPDELVEVDKPSESEQLRKTPTAIETSTKDQVIALKKDDLIENEELLYWGDFGKALVYFVDNPDADYFSEAAKEAFLKTLTALKLTLSDVAVINLYRLSFSISDIKKQLNPKILVYSTGPREGYEQRFNQFFDEEASQVLITYTFEEMLTSNEKKRAFWNAIKEMKV